MRTAAQCSPSSATPPSDCRPCPAVLVAPSVGAGFPRSLALSLDSSLETAHAAAPASPAVLEAAASPALATDSSAKRRSTNVRGEGRHRGVRRGARGVGGIIDRFQTVKCPCDSRRRYHCVSALSGRPTPVHGGRRGYYCDTKRRRLKTGKQSSPLTPTPMRAVRLLAASIAGSPARAVQTTTLFDRC